MKNREELIQSANKMNPFSEKAKEQFAKKKDLIISRVNELMTSDHRVVRYTENTSEEKMMINHSNHVHFMESILKNFNAEVLVSTILWVYRTYRSHGFAPEYWEVAFDKYEQAIKDHMDTDAYSEVSNIYSWMKKHHVDFVKLTDTAMQG